MYSCLIRFKVVFIVVILFLGIGNNVLGFDLEEEISATFQKYFNGGKTDSYLESPYTSTYSKDPYMDSVKDVEDMSMNLKISGAEYIDNVLKENGCSMQQKKIWAILYYFLPEFRMEIARSLKMNLGDYSSKNFTLDETKITKYCNEYYACMEYKPGKNDFLQGYEKVTKDTPQNIITNCKEFFEKNYKRGEESEKREQNIQISQLGADKYWNSTTDDSPYDIMSDMGTIARLLYTEAEQPITPVLYKLPLFSNSEKSLKSHKEKGSSYSILGKTRTKDILNIGGSSNINGSLINLNIDGGSSSNPMPLPLPRGAEGLNMEDGYSNIVEGLGSSRAKLNNSISNGNECDNEHSGNGGGNTQDSEYEDDPSSNNSIQDPIDVSDVSEENLEEVINYMKGAVDKYASLSDEKNAEIKSKAGDTSRFQNDVTPDELEETANEIKDCWQGCEGLRIDQKASCMIMCACGEIESPIFNPDETPGLGPIFTIRFCAVPGVNTKFSLGGKKIVSIEEMVNEIYGVVDKLSREGRLGIWTQQYNFLDSTTKKMNVSDTIAFSIDIEFVDIFDNYSNRSSQYKNKELKESNAKWQENHHISNKLDNPVSKNYFSLVAKVGETNNDFTNQANSEGTKQSQSNLMETPSSVVDLESNSRANSYIDRSQLLGSWMDQQGNLWVETLGYVKDFYNSARVLNGKPKIK